MTSVAAWVLFPLVAYVLAAGLALLAGSLVKATVPGPLLAPVGFFLGIVVTLPVYKLGGNQWSAAVLLVVLALAGHVLARKRWWERVRPGWPGLAALLAYGLYMAPVVLSGHWRWLGYNFVNDTAVNMVMIDHLAHHGVRFATGPDSTTKSLINGTLASQYPMGLHSLVASLRAVLGFLPLAAVYQPFIALAAGLAAACLAWLATLLGVRGLVAAGIGTVASGGNLAYWYASHGAFKELAMVTVVATSAALCGLVVHERLRVGWVAQLGAVFAASVGIFATAALAYVGVFAIVLLAALMVRSDRPRVGRLAVAAAAGLGAMLLTGFSGLSDAVSYGRGASTYYAAAGGLSGPNSTAFLGHLLRPLPLQEGIGIWLGSDYRLPLLGTASAVTGALTVLVVALLAVSVAAELWRRRPVALLVLVAPLAVYLVGHTRLGPYAEAKLLVILTPAVVFAALIGAVWVGRRVRVAGLAAGLVVAGSVLVSNAFAYHSARLAPVDRLQAFADAAGHAPAGGMVLVPEWEEWAKYFDAGRRLDVSSEAFSPRPLELRTYFPYFAHSIDLDQMSLRFADSFRSIVLRRGPDSSRPPADYRRSYQNQWYALWLKDPAGPAVLDHLPLQAANQAVQLPDCDALRTMVKALRPGEQLLGAPGEPTRLFDYTGRPPVGWNPGADPYTVVPNRPGAARGPLWLPAGRYRVWLRGSSGRRLTVKVDGRVVGRPVGVNTPDTWLPAGAATIRRTATHSIELRRPGGGLAPGDGYAAEIGPVAFEHVGARPPLTRIPRRAVTRACGRVWDWIERVRPAGPPTRPVG